MHGGMAVGMEWLSSGCPSDVAAGSSVFRCRLRVNVGGGVGGDMCACVGVGMAVGMHMYIYVCVYIYTNIHIYIDMYIYIYIYIYIRVSISICICMCIYRYIHITTRTQIMQGGGRRENNTVPRNSSHLHLRRSILSGRTNWYPSVSIYPYIYHVCTSDTRF